MKYMTWNVRLVFLLAVFSISIYLVLGELAKGGLIVSGLIAFLFVLKRPAEYIVCFNKYNFPFFVSIILFPACYGLSYMMYGAKHDYEFFVEFSRISFLVLAIFAFLRKENGGDFGVLKISIASFGVLSGASGLFLGVSEGGRIAVGTDLINMYGMLMACASSLGFFYFLKEKKRLMMVFYFASSVLSLCGVLFSGSKIALLALVAVIFISIVFHGGPKKKLLFYVLFPMMLLVGVLGPTERFLLMGEVVLEEFQKMTDSDAGSQPETLANKELEGSVWIRMQMYKAAVDAISEKPVKGHGTWRFKDLFPEYYSSDRLPEWSKRFAHVHNELLQAWMTRGLLGLFSFALLILAPLLAAKNMGVEFSWSIMITVFVFFLVSMFEAPFNANITYVFYTAILALILIFPDAKDKPILDDSV